MNKKIAIIALIAILTVALFVACSCDNTSDAVVEVLANSESVRIKDTDVENYDYTSLFTITKDQANVTVEKSYLDLSAVSATARSFTVTCTYQDKSATVTVDVTATVYSVVAIKPEFTVEDAEVYNYDYKSYFAVRVDGVRIPVSDDMVTTDLTNQAGTYTYTVTCGTAQASMTVYVEHINRTVELAQQSVTLNQTLVEDYDFNALFTVQTNGKKINITQEMVTTDVCDQVGTYTYTVTHGQASATLTVCVTDAHEVVIVPSYNTLQLSVDKLENFDYTQLFSLYVDGFAVQVTRDMLDVSALQGATAGSLCTVQMSYTSGSVIFTANTQISVLPIEEVQVSTKNLVTYPNGDFIEITSLFSITKGEETVVVTNDMVSGTIDYSKEGVNEIVLLYDGQTYVSTVEVKRGVIIGYTNGDVVTVRRGTDKNSYLFAEDFTVYVNGLRFRNIANYIDASAVDFGTTGQYQATISVPYNEKQLGLSGAKLVYYTQTITYNVVDYEYNLSVKDSNVVLSKGTTEYNVFGNLNLTRNNYTNQIGDNADWINAIYCYGQVVSEPLDFTKVGKQLVEIDVYVGCFKVGDALGDAVRVSFYVEIKNDVTIVAHNTITFGGTLFTKDLFSVSDGEQIVEVTNDMVSGKVDTFNAGVYTVTCQYLGVSATATVIVLNSDMIGVYQTGQTLIASSDNDDDYDDYEDYWGDGWGDDISGYSLAPAASVLGKMTISADGEMVVNGQKGQIVEGIDQSTLLVKIGSYNYTLYYNNGIVVLDPDNSIKLGFSENKRPLVYFNSAQWALQNSVTVNSSSKHVLEGTAICYSYDVFNVTEVNGEADIWYGVRIHLISKTSADTIYEVTFGEVTFGEAFVPMAGTSSSLTLNGLTEEFTMQSDLVGKINAAVVSSEWNNKVFVGNINGQNATLAVSSATNITYSIEGKKVISASAYELANYMKNGGCNFADNTVLLYNYNKAEGEISSYKFSVDPENNTFQLLQKDGIFGKYTTEDGSMWLFLDGYGKGVISFNSKSGFTTQFTYTLKNQELKLTFFNVNSTFSYGTYLTFNLADLKNVLTAKYSLNNFLGSKQFVNEVITDGAIVRFLTSKVNSDASYQNDILNGIEIVTKDGVLTYEQKAAKVNNVAVVDTSSVDPNKAGIYQISVNITVDGKLVKSYYAVQIVTKIYENSTLIGTFGSGVINSGYTFSMDAYGNVKLHSSGKDFDGYAVISEEDGTFAGKAFATDGSSVVLRGNRFSDGVVLLRCSGAVSFSDYFTAGEKVVAGCESGILRKISTDSDTYIWSTSADSMGEKVSVVATEEAGVFVVTRQNGTSFVVKPNWGNIKNGLVLADKLRGSYVSENSETLTLDGFGKITVGSEVGSYLANGNTVTVTMTDGLFAYRLDTVNGTYQQLQVDVPKLIQNKTFTATYNFSDESGIYSATTIITFGANGVATMVSTSSDYEQENNVTYNAGFANAEGVVGSYIINKNKIIVEIGGQTFAFRITDVVECSSIICDSTTLASNSIGYFAVGTAFSSEM